MSESLHKFYYRRFSDKTVSSAGNAGDFNVFKVEDVFGPGKPPVEYTRREFFKIALMRGKHIYHYADKSLEINGSTLIFFNPDIPYTFEAKTKQSSGYFCIFKEVFFSEYLRKGLRSLPMYQIGGNPAFVLDDNNNKVVSNIFEKIIKEFHSNYRFKYNLIRNYIIEIIYTALKLEPSENLYTDINANTRITGVFMELLERQFPIESRSQQFKMNKARDFAQRLSMHRNHLNRAVKKTTGKTTTDIIYDRIIKEAKALLKHTNWNISEIGFSLGYEDPSHFNHFFKNQTNSIPSDHRQ